MWNIEIHLRFKRWEWTWRQLIWVCFWTRNIGIHPDYGISTVDKKVGLINPSVKILAALSSHTSRNDLNSKINLSMKKKKKKKEKKKKEKKKKNQFLKVL